MNHSLQGPTEWFPNLLESRPSAPSNQYWLRSGQTYSDSSATAESSSSPSASSAGYRWQADAAHTIGAQQTSSAAKDPKTAAAKIDSAAASPEEGEQEEEGLEDEVLSFGGLTKKARIRERNRISASKCREKRRFQAHRLEEEARELSQKHRELIYAVKTLQDQLYALKANCLDHVDCNCVQIREYLLQLNPAVTPISSYSSDQSFGDYFSVQGY